MHNMQSPTFKNGQRVLHFMFGITRTKGQKACVQQINIRKTFFILIFYIDLILIIHAKIVLHRPSPNMPSRQHALPSHHQNMPSHQHAFPSHQTSFMPHRKISIHMSSTSSIRTCIHAGAGNLSQRIRYYLISWDVSGKGGRE